MNYKDRKFIVEKDCFCEYYLHEKFSHFREGLVEKKLKKGDIVSFRKEWKNLYGHYIQVEKDGETYEIRPEFLKEELNVKEIAKKIQEELLEVIKAVKELGEEIGYKQLTTLATALWRRSLKEEGDIEDPMVVVPENCVNKSTLDILQKENRMYDFLIEKYFKKLEEDEK